MTELTLLFLVALATFGLSTLISNYDGAFDVFTKLRRVSKVFSCTVCLSVWVSPIFLILAGIGLTTVVVVFAIIGLVIILERLT